MSTNRLVATEDGKSQAAFQGGADESEAGENFHRRFVLSEVDNEINAFKKGKK